MALSSVAAMDRIPYLPLTGAPHVRLQDAPPALAFALPPLDLGWRRTNDGAAITETNQAAASTQTAASITAPAAAATNLSIVTNIIAAPLPAETLPEIPPQTFLQFFRDHGTNGSVSATIPVTITPPKFAPPGSSSATYQSK